MKTMQWLRSSKQTFEGFATADLPSAGAWRAFTHVYS